MHDHSIWVLTLSGFIINLQSITQNSLSIFNFPFSEIETSATSAAIFFNSLEFNPNQSLIVIILPLFLGSLDPQFDSNAIFSRTFLSLNRFNLYYRGSTFA